MIRQFHLHDTETLVSIWRAASALAHPFLEESFLEQEAVNLRRLYLPNAETWVLEANGQPVGFIALIDQEIGGLFLAPSVRGRGFGRQLVDHAVALKGTLTVDVFEKNEIGRRFYRAYGFTETGRYTHAASGEQTLKLALPAP